MITNTNVLSRTEMAITVAASLIESKFTTFDAIEAAMSELGLQYEEQSDEIFDLIARMLCA